MRTRLMRISLLTSFLLTLLFVTDSKAFDNLDTTVMYTITAEHSGKCLNVFGGVFSTGNGVIVEQWDCNNGTNQLWDIHDAGKGYYTITAQHSGSILEIDPLPGAETNGAKAQQWHNQHAPYQRFMLNAVRKR